MPKRIAVAQYYRVGQLQQADHQASDVIEVRQYQMIWLLALGKRRGI